MSESEREDDGDEVPGRVRRAFRDHGSFESADDGGWRSVTTAFDAAVEAEPPSEDGRIRLSIVVRVPTLSAVTVDDVADVVETGWYETFERRVVDVGGVTRGDHEFDPRVGRDDDEIVVRFALTDINERRGVDDAGALIDFVEGTYVQGVIPGYEYTDPVSGLVSSARRQGDGGTV
ncbi:DUF5813 family protein [Halorubrum halodurans]|uniref:Uncharacterized protein n=1 Tax=Halorubrum halodurans TaxID=1383851 RepID=A0A256IKP9_9EURY|nr:DUF5813 family protein [Halorubrum halodurans]OYR56732.1 hypothetical protein DJ70_07430 [Halorubrum halodurans]